MLGRNACRASALVGLILVSISLPTQARERYQDTLNPEHVKTGAVVSERDCMALAEAVWVVVEGRGDCIRYYASGLRKGANRTVFTWFHGDRLARRHAKGDFFKTTGQEVIAYNDNQPDVLRAKMAKWVGEFGKPALFVARPGVYGSSGDHTQRRQPREIVLVRRALDAIKARYRIESFIIAGQSGGGHVTASLLAQRRDIECAVLTSAPGAVRVRIEIKKWPADGTGATSFYDPIEHVGEINGHPSLRIFVVGDARDKAVPFRSQQVYFEALKAKGLEAHLVAAQSEDEKQFHGLSSLGMRIAGWCASGTATDEILKRVRADPHGR
jgi:hypothetical protein